MCMVKRFISTILLTLMLVGCGASAHPAESENAISSEIATEREAIVSSEKSAEQQNNISTGISPEQIEVASIETDADSTATITTPENVYTADWTGDEVLRSAVEQTNIYRKNAGIAPLQWSEELGQAAIIRAGEVLVKFEHTRPDGTLATTVSPQTHGENLCRCNVVRSVTGTEFVNQLMTSPSHRHAILNPDYDYIGISYAFDNDGHMHFVQLFGY